MAVFEDGYKKDMEVNRNIKNKIVSSTLSAIYVCLLPEVFSYSENVHLKFTRNRRRLIFRTIDLT